MLFEPWWKEIIHFPKKKITHTQNQTKTPNCCMKKNMKMKWIGTKRSSSSTNKKISFFYRLCFVVGYGYGCSFSTDVGHLKLILLCVERTVKQNVYVHTSSPLISELFSILVDWWRNFNNNRIGSPLQWWLEWNGMKGWLTDTYPVPADPILNKIDNVSLSNLKSWRRRRVSIRKLQKVINIQYYCQLTMKEKIFRL